MRNNEKRLLVITTGGTIAGNVGHDLDSAPLPDQSLMLRLEATLADIRSKRRSDELLRIDTRELFDKDSTDVGPGEWSQLISAIEEEYEATDAFVVTHGTNTLGYTCAALSFAFENLDKPVVLTGSQVPYGSPGSDALMNLENAVRVALLEDEPGPVRGISCVFGSHIIIGTRVKKSTEFDYDAFQSFSTSSLGRIGRVIRWNGDNLSRHQEYVHSQDVPLKVSNTFDPRVLSLTEFPGMSSKLFAQIVETHSPKTLRGIVFRAFGAGDVSGNLIPAFQRMVELQIPVVVTTQAPNGISNFNVNEPGIRLRREGLAIPAFDMNIESITAKLMWCLGRNLSYEQIKMEFGTNLKGEISLEDRRPV